MSKFKTAEFEALKTVWYEKLEKSGFVDIEETKGSKDYLKTWDSQWFLTRFQESSLKFEARQEYYNIVQNYVNNLKREQLNFFNNEDIEFQIWTLHANGRSLREIASQLGTKICRVHASVKKLAKIIAVKPNG
jgi:hypothetical protein